MREEEALCNMHLENFPLSVIEVKYCQIHILSKQMHQNLGYLIAVKFARMETTNSAIPDTSFLVLKIGDCDDLDFWRNKAKSGMLC